MHKKPKGSLKALVVDVTAITNATNVLIRAIYQGCNGSVTTANLMEIIRAAVHNEEIHARWIKIIRRGKPGSPTRAVIKKFLRPLNLESVRLVPGLDHLNFFHQHSIPVVLVADRIFQRYVAKIPDEFAARFKEIHIFSSKESRGSGRTKTLATLCRRMGYKPAEVGYYSMNPSHFASVRMAGLCGIARPDLHVEEEELEQAGARVIVSSFREVFNLYQ